MNTPLTVVAADTHRAVWATRARIVDRWPTPDYVDSLRFAVSEVGEALDAQLRTDATYRRNHERASSVQEELADVAIMLATALGEWLPADLFGRAATARAILGCSNDLDSLPRLVADALDQLTHGVCTWHMRTAVALLATLQLLHDPVPAVRAKLARLEAKADRSGPTGGASLAGASDAPSEASPCSLPSAAGRPDVQVVPPGVGGAREIAPLAVAKLTDVIAAQRRKGMNEYGAPLTDKTRFPAWSFIWEELADLAVYLMRLEVDYRALVDEVAPAKLAETTVDAEA